MKKLLKLVSSALVIFTSSANIIACSPPSLGEIWIITDGGVIDDKAFNQQVLEGSQQFTTKFNDDRSTISTFPGFDYWKDHKIRLKTITPANGEVATLQNNYNIAAYAGAKTIICVGFHHIAALTPEIQAIYKALGVRFILVDGLADNNPPIDVAGLTYAADQSGFLAGLAGASWLMANHEDYQLTEDPNKAKDSNQNVNFSKPFLKMATFGGQPAQTVLTYMYGYYWGVQYFNIEKNNSNHQILDLVNDLRPADKAMTESDLTNYNPVIFDNPNKSFTGSFSPGTLDARTLTDNLINGNRNNIVLPVAGGQTTDLLATILNSGSASKIIGVDVDQSIQYEAAKNLFLTSALKGIKKSVDWMLWHSLDLNQDDTTGNITPQDGAEYFSQQKSSSLHGSGYTGIANNPPIAAIYNSIMNNFQTQADAVSTALAGSFTKEGSGDHWAEVWDRLLAANPTSSKYRPAF